MKLECVGIETIYQVIKDLIFGLRCVENSLILIYMKENYTELKQSLHQNESCKAAATAISSFIFKLDKLLQMSIFKYNLEAVKSLHDIFKGFIEDLLSANCEIREYTANTYSDYKLIVQQYSRKLSKFVQQNQNRFEGL